MEINEELILKMKDGLRVTDDKGTEFFIERSDQGYDRPYWCFGYQGVGCNGVSGGVACNWTKKTAQRMVELLKENWNNDYWVRDEEEKLLMEMLPF